LFLSETNLTESKILIVDDTSHNIFYLKEIIGELGQTYFAESGQDALALIPQILPDLILLDIEMPEINGWEVCKSLKADRRFSDIPIIFITGHNQPKFEQLALEIGGVDFITKPFNPAVCRLRVDNQLKLRKQHRLIEHGRAQLQTLVRQVPVLITYWDENLNNLFTNDYLGAWFKQNENKDSGSNIVDIFPAPLSQAIQANVKNNNTEQQFVVQTNENTGTQFYQVFKSALMNNYDREGYMVTLVDISEVKRAKQALYAEKERLRVTLNSIGDAVIATDIAGCVTFMNPIAERMTGWRFRDAQHQKIEQVMPLQDADTKQSHKNPIYLALSEQRIVAMALNSQLVSINGKTFDVEDSAAPIRNENGELIGAIMVFHDVSETMAMSIKMSHLANHDQLTNLPNRILLQDRLTVACSSAKANEEKACVLLIDIDHFKYLNDTLGHQYGDELICLMAKRLSQLLPQSCTLSRLGGDEFVILMSERVSAESIALLASKLLDSMHEQFCLAGQMYSVSVSLGISIYPDDAYDSEQLMRHADVAMYRAKQEGRNRYCFFAIELEQELMKRQQLESRLRDALKKHELVVQYQPKFNLNTQKIVGAEALVRLLDEEGRFISPADFIPLAEETGLVVELGKQVLLKACEQAKVLLDKGFDVPISVNVAAAQFGSLELEQDIQCAIAINEIPANLIELEITETALMVDAQATQNKLEQLKGLGINISIDDFGTGYSSLAYLKKFKVDIMKIDMSFVRDMLNNKHDFEIVKTIISLGHSMGLKLVAEGVETKEQQQALSTLGCEIGQGYVFSKPISAEQLLRLLEK
tara:strand:- start:4409 stop:6856 length:2448 start_codon:yes stop_codon:yes gene_type:complete